jgi:hypothetical protein
MGIPLEHRALGRSIVTCQFDLSPFARYAVFRL